MADARLKAPCMAWSARATLRRGGDERPRLARYRALADKVVTDAYVTFHARGLRGTGRVADDGAGVHHRGGDSDGA